jgi:hypothetical protein
MVALINYHGKNSLHLEIRESRGIRRYDFCK